MKKILITTDFSNNSKTGIRFAIQLAAEAECELVFCNVNVLSSVNTWTELHYNDFKDSENAILRNRLEKFISDIYLKSGKQTGKADYVIVNGPDVDTVIIDYAQKINADMICMGTRGGGVISHFLGTNASKLITTSPIPLFVVPHNYRMKPLRTIFYASDIQHVGIELRAVLQFAEPFRAEIDVYHYDYLLNYAEEVAKLKKVADRHYFKNVRFHFMKLNAELSLLNHMQIDIRKSKPSVIAMFTRQDRNWFERLFLSSKTAELGFDTKTPLLVFRKGYHDKQDI